MNNEADLPVTIISLRSSLENKTGTWRNTAPVLQELIAPCRQACPINNDIPRFLQAIADDRFSDALAILREETPFPGVTARVCSRFCMVACSRKDIDGSRIPIADLERAAADYGTPQAPVLRDATGCSVAVVGAGPAGLTAAYFLAWMGHTVTVFEAEAQPGGQLRTDRRYARVPEEVLNREIDLIFELGIEFHPKTRLGTDLAWNDLGRFDAVYLAVDEEHLPANEGFVVDDRLNVAVSQTLVEGTFIAYAAPDTDVKRWMITYAIRAGKRAALLLDRALTEHTHAVSALPLGPDGAVSLTRYLKGTPLATRPEVAGLDHINRDTLDFRPFNPYPPLPAEAPPVTEGGLARHEAVAQAQRCMSCGVCNLCTVCVASCPDMAIAVIDGQLVLNYDYCKGCAICVEECPRGALGRSFDI